MILNESFSLVVQHFQFINYFNIECRLNFLENMLKLFSYGVSPVQERCSSDDTTPIDDDNKNHYLIKSSRAMHLEKTGQSNIVTTLKIKFLTIGHAKMKIPRIK